MLPLCDIYELEVKVNAQCFSKQHNGATGWTWRKVIIINRHLAVSPRFSVLVSLFSRVFRSHDSPVLSGFRFTATSSKEKLFKFVNLRFAYTIQKQQAYESQRQVYVQKDRRESIVLSEILLYRSNCVLNKIIVY